MTTSPTLTEPRPATSAPGGALTVETLRSLQADLENHPASRLARNAVTQMSVDDVALNRAVVASTDHTFSHLLDDWAVTNQKKSGRCWMFAGLNLLRVGAMKKMNLKEFELSQNHTLFYDKLERANYFLEAIIETAERPVDDRTVAFLLERPLEDGGQWNMFVNIVKRHGLVPKAFMPETESSSNTRRMNTIVMAKLRQGAKELRDLRAGGAPKEALRAAKHEILKTVCRILCIHLGNPPERIDWQWNDQEKGFHRDGEMTPLEFARKYVELPLDEFVCLVHDPRETSPFGRTFTVKYLGNVVGGDIVRYLNVEIGLMKEVAMRTLMGGEPVWFGCDVGKMMRRDLGLWDADLFDYQGIYDTTFELDKAGRLQYHQTVMTHAMLFTGVDVVDGGPRRWRVENSWGDEIGRKGFFVMNDSWFDEHMFEIAARRSALPDDLQAAIDLEPIVLPPWDPMGALARAR
ncbi:MAG: C1 family peptidase [Planctomycetota bacterium]|jgi:bleomycin hydrolase